MPHELSLEDTEKMIASCTACNRHKPRQQKEPMMMHEIPTLPYKIVATDLFEWQNQMYLVTVDSYSGFYFLFIYFFLYIYIYFFAICLYLLNNKGKI